MKLNKARTSAWLVPMILNVLGGWAICVNEVRLRNVDGKLFMNEEVLAKNENGTLGLTYTRELDIHFEENNMILTINGNELVGKKVE